MKLYTRIIASLLTATAAVATGYAIANAVTPEPVSTTVISEKIHTTP